MAEDIEYNDSLVTIVVPFNKWNEEVIECVQNCGFLDWEKFIIWLLPDDLPTADWQEKLNQFNLGEKLFIRPTGSGNPAYKRNIALKESKSSLFALVDADAYPRSDWLRKGIPLLSEEIGIVAGPNLTPPKDPLLRRIAGNIMKSPLGFGAAYIRHTPQKRQFVAEMPTCNMILKRYDDLLFEESLDTAEDMFYCFQARQRGKKILYDPEVVVFHHRRWLWKPFAQQFYYYGLDKGRLAQTRKKLTYFWHMMPAILVVYHIFLIPVALFLYHSWDRFWIGVSLLPIFFYWILVMIESIRSSKGIIELILNMAAFLVAHLSYGTGYLTGFLQKSSKTE